MSYNHIEPQSLNDRNYDYKPNYMKKIYIKNPTVGSVTYLNASPLTVPYVSSNPFATV